MADKVISDALKLDDSVYTRKPFTLSSDSSVPDTKYKTMSDVVRSAKIDDSWKTPTIESIGNLKKGYDATQIEEFATTFGVGGLARLGQTALGNIINAVEDPTRFAGSAIGAGIGATAGLKLAGKAALGKVGGWLARALASTGGAVAGGALGGAIVSALTPTPAGDEDEWEKIARATGLTPRYRWENAIEKYNRGEISDEEYETARNEYLLSQDEKYQALIDKYGKDYKKYARNRDIIIDTIKGRQYPVSNVADYVVQSAAQGIENIEEWKQNIYNNAGIDQSSIGSQAGEAIGSVAEFIGLAWLGKKGFGRSKAKQIEGVYSATTGKPKVVTTTPARKEVEQKVENLLKAYSFGELSGLYTADNVLDYLDKTGDTTFKDLDITDRQTAMAASYGVMGTLVEFMGGIEPVLTGAVRKLGAKTPVLRAGLRVSAEEGAEELVQRLQEFLVRKIDNTSDETFGDALKEGLQAAAWGAVLGGSIGSITYSKNRSNIVKSLRKNFPQMTEPEATKIADNMIESVTENLSPEHKALFDDLRAKVAYMYEDADLDEAEKADAIDSTARLEFALASNYATENGIDVSEVPIFGETNEIGWFRAGITPEQRVEIDRYLSEVRELKQQQTETQDQLNKADKTNTALITELGEKLDNINAKLEVLQSDEYRIRQLRTRATARISQNMRANLANKREDLQTALEASGLKLGLRKPRYVSDHGSLYFTVLAGKNGQAQINIRVSDTPFTDKKKKIHLALNTNVTPAEFVSAVQSLVEQANNAENITEFLKQQVQNTIDKQPRTGRVYFQEQFDLANENARLDEIYPEYTGETINIDGKGRTVYNSNGDRIAKSAEALTNFWRWFGNSKVVDEQGRPLVVYHGTSSEFDTFNIAESGKNTGTAIYGQGFYFTTDKEVATKWGAKRGEPIVMGVYVKLENPNMVKELEYPKDSKEKGFDGVIAKVWGGNELEIVAFEPNQIKSVDNRGTYSSDTGNIYEQNKKRGAYMPAIRLILRSQKMDVSTLSHELAHDWFEIYTSHYRSGDASKEFMRSWGLVEKAFGIEDGNPTTIRNASEAFARAYEAWVVNKQDWDKNVALSAPERDEVIKTFQRYQNYLRDIYGTMTNKYFMETWGKVGELKPELKQWFDSMTAVSETETPKTTAETVLEAVERSNLTDEEKQDVRRAVALNTPERYEVEGGNKNALQNRLSILARDIDQNNMILKKNYDTRRDMLAVAKAADEFVRTRQDEALDIINGNKSEVEGLFKEDLYTALERLAVENNDLELLQTLSESQVANGLAKELGQRVAGFRNFLANSDVDIVSTYNNLQKKYNNAIKPRGQQQINESADLFVELVAEEDVKSMQELDSILKDMECK